MNILHLSFTIILLNACSLQILSQEDISSELGYHLENILQDMDEDEEANLEEIFEEYTSLAAQKQNINHISAETLEKLHFLTAYQLHSFLEYREKYGTIYSKNELWLIPGFHEDLINIFLILFDCTFSAQVTGSSTSHKSWVKQMLLYRVKTDMPRRQGYLEDIDSTSRFYGPPIYHLWKYELDQKSFFRSGITLENDAGESFRFDTIQKGFDFQSAYVEFKGKKILDRLIIGDYKVLAGEGLILSSGRNGKSSLQSFRRSVPEIKKYSSTAEYGFYRGGAIQLSPGKFRLISFYSRKKESAKIYEANDSISFFRSLNTAGLHRNMNENWNRGNIIRNEAGISLSITTDRFQAGYNGKISSWNPALSWYALGDVWSEQIISRRLFWNSIFYNFQHTRFLFSGELSAGKTGALAYLQKASLFPHPLLTLNFVYRNFFPGYFCPGANSFSEKGAPRNEKGFYTGIIAYPFPFLKLSSYIDLYHFPRIDHSSSFPVTGIDFFMDTEWYFNRNIDLRMVIKSESKAAKVAEKKTGISPMEPVMTTRLYLQLGYHVHSRLQAKSRIEIKKVIKEDDKTSIGTLIYQELNQSFFDERIKYNLRYTLFDIPGWDARIYSWEHDLLYSFSSPVWYKNGYNLFLNFRWKASPWCNVGLKGSVTGYTSPRESGSGGDYRKSERYFEVKGQIMIKISELGSRRSRDQKIKEFGK